MPASCAVFRIAHASDLHLRGTDEDREFLDGLFSSFAEYGVDHVVITGDVSDGGEADAFRVLDEVRREHGYGPRRSTVLPGNHDLPGLSAFIRRFGWHFRGGVRRIAGGAITLVCFNTTGDNGMVPWDPMGWLDPDEITALRRSLGQLARGRTARIVACHHYLFDAALGFAEGLAHDLPQAFGQEPIFGPVRNAQDLRGDLVERGVCAALSGHLHDAQLRVFGPRAAPLRCFVAGASPDEAGYWALDFRGPRFVSHGWGGSLRDLRVSARDRVRSVRRRLRHGLRRVRRGRDAVVRPL
jgi:hypothetical protein